MGNNVYSKIAHVIPPNLFKAFQDEADRSQFIHAVMTVLSNNGKLDLQFYSFRLLYSRKPNDRVQATFVAVKEGVIEAKIEPDRDGKDQAQAFLALKRHVELRLHELLEHIPDAGTAGSSAAAASGTLQSAIDAPPSYDSSKAALGVFGKRG